MWTRNDAARILALAAVVLTVGLLLFPPVAHPAPARPPSPAKWIADRVNGRPSDLVAVRCLRLGRGWMLCGLEIQRTPRIRQCWTVTLSPTRRSWRVRDVQAIEPARCPVLRSRSRQSLRALKQ